MTEQSKPTGRDGPNAMVGFRCPPELREALQNAADEGDRSLASEMERRLRRSFDPDLLVDDAADMVVHGAGHQSEEAYQFALNTLSRVFGDKATDVAATMAHILGMVTQSEAHRNRRPTSGAAMRLTIPRSALNELKDAIVRIERECIIVDDKELEAKSAE